MTTLATHIKKVKTRAAVEKKNIAAQHVTARKVTASGTPTVTAHAAKTAETARLAAELRGERAVREALAKQVVDLERELDRLTEELRGERIARQQVSAQGKRGGGTGLVHVLR